MAGYEGYSKSNNAAAAESEGRFPLTKAVVVVARSSGISQKEARRVLLELGSFEYHHSSKFYNQVDYYDTAVAINLIKYGTEETPEEIAKAKSWDREYKLLLKKQASCQHNWIGKPYHWYCPVCGSYEFTWEKP